jgi:hypothetical protein
MRSVLVLTLLLVGAVAAQAQDVRYNFDKEAKFSSFKTYKWVVLKEGRVPNELVDLQIKAAIDAELATKGLERIDSDNADLYIGYQAGLNTEKQYTSFDTGWGYGPGWYRGGWYGGGGMTTTTGTTSTIYIGQLAVDVYHAGPKQLVWRGVASKTIDTKAKPDKQQKNLAKAVTKLFKNYPPPPPKG